MIRLALRLVLGGGREPLVRLAVTALGVAMGAALLLLAGALYPALHAHEARMAWRTTSADNTRPAHSPATTGPLLWRLRVDTFDGQDIVWVDEAALGPRSPVPPGLSRLPGPGQLAVSPALGRLLRTTPPRMLGDRFPGQVVATVGDAALLGPGELVVFAGHTPAQLRGQAGVVEVHSIESAPSSVALTRFGRVVLGIAVVALLFPILMLVATATRLAAARREQRLAALRLAGATPGQVRFVTVVEAVLATAAGTALGFLAFVITRPEDARFNIDGSAFFPSDLHLSPGLAALVGIGMPALGAGAALASLRRVQVSPLGVARRAPQGQPTWRRLIPLGAGLAVFAAALPALITAQGDWAVAANFALIGLIIGGIVIAGPLLTLGVGRLLGRLASHPPALLAGRRLADNPAAGFRAISGLILAVFVVTLVSEFAASGQGPQAGKGPSQMPRGAVLQEIAGPGIPALGPGRAATVTAALRRSAGISDVIDLRVAPGRLDPAGSVQDGTLLLAARCAGLRAAGLASCGDPAAIVGIQIGLLDRGQSLAVARPLPGVGLAGLAGLPLAGLVVTTRGGPSAIEVARTALDTTVGGAAWLLPVTAADITAQNRHQLTQLARLSSAGLLVTLLIAGFSLTISIAGGLLERRRPFALLRLGGMRVGDLRRVLLAETAIPLLVIAITSTGLAVALASYVFWTTHTPWEPPDPAFWPALAGGLLLALAVASAATMPLLSRLTSLETARFE